MHIFVRNRQIVLAGILFALCWPPAMARSTTGVPDFTVCYNYGCKRMDQVVLTADEWNEVLFVFSSEAESAQQERQQVRLAIALMEQFVGRHTPTYRDRGKNPPTDAWPGQMDCIDESVNTTRYLQLFETYGGLRWHRVSSRVVRSPYIFDWHWAGQLVERSTQQHYVVDSWYRDNGSVPHIQTVEEWMRKELFEDLTTDERDGG